MIFITLEGIDGSGKTTSAKIISDHLSIKGYDILLTREPGGDKISEKIRDIILDNDHSNMSSWTETLLYVASRKQHIDEVIKPALENKKIVICDRFRDSTSAYQGYARGIGIEGVDEVQNIVLGDITPDLTIFFAITPEEAEKRLNSRKRSADRLDSEGLEFQKKVYEGYEILVNKHSNRIKKIDATKGIEQVTNSAIDLIEKFLEGVN